jgi:geranylgeranyl pyrophosphate synthase
MTLAATYDDSFLRDMSPPLADRYHRWYPYCRASVLDTIDRIGTPEFLEGALGQPLSTQQYDILREAWLDPYRSYHQRSGKMLRPFLVCLCVEAHGGDPMAIPAGMVALAELIHAASLVLDDIADDSPLRRGGPTAHRMVGLRVAGAMGSAWLNVCFELLSTEDLGISPEAANLLMDQIAWEHWVTGVGTTIDTTWPWMGRFDHEPAQYLQSVVHRSTSYTYRLPLTIGAVAAGATAEQREQWAALGEEVGLAFQIVDDMLNVRRTDDKWGKALAEDLTQGKVTLQVLLALRRATQEDRDRLIGILVSRTQDPDRLAEAVSIIDRTGAFDAAGEIAAHHIRRTKQIASGLDFVTEEYRMMLRDFIDYIVKRTR